MICQRAFRHYSKKECERNPNFLYVFTDNCNRTSGKTKIDDNSEYSRRFGLSNLKRPSIATSAVIRGCPNAYPLTTCRSYSAKDNRWEDKDFAEFKRIIDDDINHIKQACEEHPYEIIIFPEHGVLNTGIANITLERTPRLFKYIVKKEIELVKFQPKRFKKKSS